MPWDKIFEIMNDDSGRGFDRECVQALARWHDRSQMQSRIEAATPRGRSVVGRVLKIWNSRPKPASRRFSTPTAVTMMETRRLLNGIGLIESFEAANLEVGASKPVGSISDAIVYILQLLSNITDRNGQTTAVLCHAGKRRIEGGRKS